MSGEMNFGILDTNLPLRAATAFQDGMASSRKNRLEELAAQQAEQQVTDDTAYRKAYQQTGGDQNALLRQLQSAGLYRQANELTKQQLEADAKRATIGKDLSVTGKNKVDAEAGQYKLTADKRDRAIRDISSFQTPQDAIASLNMHIQNGELPPDAGEKMKASIPQDQEGFAAWKQKMLTGLLGAKDQIDLTTPKPQQINLGNRVAFVDMNPNSPTFRKEVSSQNVAMSPGESARIGLEGQRIAQSERHFQTTNAQGKAPTEFQGKSANYGARAEEADKIISNLDGKYSPSAINAKQGLGQVWGVGGALESGFNMLLGEGSQKAEQAQRDFINAVLRQESGAAIADTEFANAKRQYFPQPGDSVGVIQQKSANRKLAIQGFKLNAGRAAFSAPDTPQAKLGQQSSGQVKFLGFE